MNDAERFLAGYDPRAFDPVAVTVDVVALTIRDAQLQVLLVRRGEQPYLGSWALPGGFVRPRTGPDGGRVEEDLALAPGLPEAQPGTDAADARWTPVAALPRPLAFDHATLLADGLERARSKL